jgi:transposase-like protein
MAVIRYTASVKNYKDYLDTWKKIKDKAPFVMVLNEVRCEYCNSKEISKYGVYKDVQRWWCKKCKRKFADSQSFPGTKLPLEAVHAALLMYYKGIPLKLIRQQIEEEFNCYPSNSTIYRVIQRLTEESFDDIKMDQPKVGNTWLIYESMITIGSKKYWILDLIDFSTHFLLSSAFASPHNPGDIKTLIESAVDKAQKIPEVLISRKTSHYQEGIELGLGAVVNKIKIETFGKKDVLNFSNFWRRMQKNRRIILYNFKIVDVARLILKGWMIYYNYYLYQKSLNLKTPSQTAKIEFPSIPNPKVKFTKPVPIKSTTLVVD